MVASQADRVAVLQLIAEQAPGTEIEDGLTVDVETPEGVSGLDWGAGAAEDPDQASLEAGDFTDQETLTDALAASGPNSSTAEDLVSEGGTVYTPPTDPVGNNTEVIGGFQASSMDDVSVERSALDGLPGDVAIEDAVRRELREDAATTDLRVAVAVDRGVVRLRGVVPYLSDAEAAEEVAARVEGVLEVREELTVEALQTSEDGPPAGQ
jgi:hypothetical protein